MPNRQNEKPSITKVLTHYFPELEGISPRQGEIKMLCPFHQDSVPSASANTKHQVFYCHACGKACDSWQIIMEMEGIKEFAEAVRFAESELSFTSGGIREPAKRRKSYSPSWS